MVQDLYHHRLSKKRDHKTQKVRHVMNYELMTLLSDNKNNKHTVECNIKKDDETLTINALIDTGALQASYVSQSVADWLKSRGTPCECGERCQKKKICSAFSNVCSKPNGEISFDLQFKNEINNVFETITILASVINTNYDIIVGRG